MRPIRLEVAGFTAFREPAVVDFDGCEFFAFSGPTGAGKSSLIDAIVFALYGSIPRLDRNAIAPLVAQGMLEAKVRLDFSVAEVPYTIVRAITLDARTGAASRSEARLQQGEEMAAGDAKSVSAEVGRLIGLSYDQFTKCVVLPQGEFARFLHDTPKDRQTLLVTLLEMEQYRRMGERARSHAEVAAERARMLTQRLSDELSFATPESRAEAEIRLSALGGLRERIEAGIPLIEELDAGIAAARTQAEAATERAGRLRSITIPAGIREAGDVARKALAARDAAAEAAEQAEQAIAATESALSALPARSVVERTLHAHAQREEALRELEKAGAALGPLHEAAGRLAKDLEATQAAVVAAEAAREAAQIEHRAADLARTLVPGEACPVCRQIVGEAPEAHVPADLKTASGALERAITARRKAEAAHRKAEGERAAGEALATAAKQRLQTLEKALAGHPDPDTLEANLAKIAEAEAAVAAAREQSAHAGRNRLAAQKAVDEADRTEREARKRFDAARDGVADLGPPAPGRDDLSADWEALAAWAARRASEEDAAAAGARESVAAAERERREKAQAMEDDARSAGVERREGERLRDAVVDAHNRQSDTLEKIDAALQEIGTVEADRRRAEEDQQVAATLGRHLSAKGFEKWLLDEAIQRLVSSAGERLLTLSSGAYSLAADSRSGSFAVVDHRNANEQRSVKTLSGGETFLASMALALALAEDLGGMAAHGVQLDAIFLDEGFGSLDPESLQVAIDAIETLTGEGRMVGLVTHVAEVAERVPVRFNVLREPGSSRVEKVIQ